MPSTPEEWAQCRIDPKVKQPRQVKAALERAEALIAGRQPRPVDVRGSRKLRKARATSAPAVQRVEALFQAFCELSPELQQHPTGGETVEALRQAVMQKMGYGALHDETVRQDIRAIRPLLRLVQKGRMPPFGPRQAAAVMRARAMRDRFERAKIRFKKFEKNLNPKCNCCVPYNWHHTPPRYWGIDQADDWLLAKLKSPVILCCEFRRRMGRDDG
jgi:hypothetical protein